MKTKIINESTIIEFHYWSGLFDFEWKNKLGMEIINVEVNEKISTREKSIEPVWISVDGVIKKIK